MTKAEFIADVTESLDKVLENDRYIGVLLVAAEDGPLSIIGIGDPSKVETIGMLRVMEKLVVEDAIDDEPVEEEEEERGPFTKLPPEWRPE